MGKLFSKKSKTKQTSVQDTTTQRTTPDWIETPTKGFVDEIGALGKTDPLSYFAGADPLQTQAAGKAAELTDSPMWGQATGLTRAGATAGPNLGTAASSLNDIQGFLSPYLKDVVDSTAADLDHDAGTSRAQFDLDNATGFGGSGIALGKSALEGELVRGKNTVLSGLRNQGYQWAGGMADSDANRQQQMTMANMGARDADAARLLSGGGQLGQLATAFGGEQRANLGTQFDIGEAMRQIEAAKKGAPLDLLKLRSDLFRNVPLDMFGGATSHATGEGTSTTSSTPSPLQMAGQAAQIAALFAGSDRRIKRDIVKLYERPDGLGVYLYRYLWSPMRYIGVMAQEVLKVKPEAVAVHPAGFLMVDYSQIGG